MKYLSSSVLFLSVLLYFSSCTKSGSATKKYGDIKSFPGLIFGSHTAASGAYTKRLSFYCSGTNTIYYTYAEAQGDTANIDICFVIDSIDRGVYLVSPDALPSVHMPAFKGGKHTTFSIDTSITPTEFTAINNDSLMIEEPEPKMTRIAMDEAGKKYINEAYFFKNNKGRIGIIYGHYYYSSSDSTNALGPSDLKVQQ